MLIRPILNNKIAFFSDFMLGRTAVQLCVEPQIVNFLSKSFHISVDSPNKRSLQACSMLDKQTIFGLAWNPNDTAKLFAKLQVCVETY